MKRILMLITAIAVMFGGMAFVAPAANADEPMVDLSDMLAGSAEFDIDASAASEAAVKTKTGVKIYLNVQAGPMKPRQIKAGTCRTAPVGKHFFNEMVDPSTGKHYFKPWNVQAGDNVFCMDTHGVWRKKSCGNAAKGIFGVPKPPKSKIRIKGVVRDYLKFTGKVAGKGNLKGSATAHVVQYDQGRKVCEAKATVNGSASAMYMASVVVRSRSMIEFETDAVSQAQANLSSDTSVKGDLEGKLKLNLEGNAMALCDYTPPMTCPEGTTWNDTNGNGQVDEGECTTPTSYTKPSASMETVNDVVENNSRTIAFTLAGNPGETLQVVADAKHGGTITAGKTQSITLDSHGNAVGSVTYTAGEVPKSSLEYSIGETRYTIAAGKDIVWLQVRDTHGNTVWGHTNDFVITPRPITPA